MANRGHSRALKFTTILIITALALTGFTTRRSSGGHGGGGDGGGCGSSNRDHDSSSSTSGSKHDYDDDDDSYYGSGGTSSGSTGRGSSSSATPTPQDATVKLISCATSKAPYATVEVTNPNGKTDRFLVSVTFLDAGGVTVTSETEEVRVPARGKVTARVEVGGEGLADSVDRCDADPYASVKR